jgi:hypothetical protein
VAARHKIALLQARMTKLILTVAFLACGGGLLSIAAEPPASGFEYTVYNQATLGLRVASVCALAAVALAWLVASQRGLYSPLLSGLVLLGATLAGGLILLMPFLRGYALVPTGDSLTHLGFARTISSTGHVSPENFYPSVHLLGSTLLSASGIDLVRLPTILSIAWYLLYVLIIRMCSTALNAGRSLADAAAVAGATLPWMELHGYIHPSVLSLILGGLVLASILANHHPVIPVLVTIVVAISHPVTPIFLALVMGTWALQSPARRHLALALLAALAVVYFAWFLRFSYVAGSIAKAFAFYTGRAEVSPFDAHLSALSAAALPWEEVARLFAAQYGGPLVWAVLCLFGIASIATTNSAPRWRLVSSSVLLGGLFTVLSAVGFTGEKEPTRVLRFALLFAPVMATKLLDNRRHLHSRKRAAVGVLVLLFIVNSHAVYGSPNTGRYNLAATAEDLQMMAYLVEQEDGVASISSDYLSVARFGDYFGHGASKRDAIAAREERPPSRFQFDDPLQGQRYVTMTSPMKLNHLVAPEAVRERAHHYGPQDLTSMWGRGDSYLIYESGSTSVTRIGAREVHISPEVNGAGD